MIDATPTLELVNHLNSMKGELAEAWTKVKKINRDLAEDIAIVGNAINDELLQYECTEKINVNAYRTIETRTKLLTAQAAKIAAKHSQPT